MSLHFTLYDERILNEGEMSCKLYFFCFSVFRTILKLDFLFEQNLKSMGDRMKTKKKKVIEKMKKEKKSYSNLLFINNRVLVV